MNLTLQTDYSLRILLYLGAAPDETCSVAKIASAFGISHNHLVKVARNLTQLGILKSVRGRTGGLRLAQHPAQINVGALVRQTEPHFHLVDCLDAEKDACRIVRHCGLKDAFATAREAFLSTLDNYTIASLLQEP